VSRIINNDEQVIEGEVDMWPVVNVLSTLPGVRLVQCASNRQPVISPRQLAPGGASPH